MWTAYDSSTNFRIEKTYGLELPYSTQNMDVGLYIILIKDYIKINNIKQKNNYID